jgi:hypothetical protein
LKQGSIPCPHSITKRVEIMKVYALFEDLGIVEGYLFLGVFSTKEKADAAAEKCKDDEYETYIVRECNIDEMAQI